MTVPEPRPPGKVRTKPPASNRSVPILDRVQKKITPVQAAKMTVEATIKRPIGKPRRLGSVADILKAMADGSPVVVEARLPRAAVGLRVPKPTVVLPTGYLALNGAEGNGLMRAVITLVTYDEKRDAVRFTPALGRGWGQGGRAWLATEDLRELLKRGAKAWAPEKGPIP
jgi:hypothetical protein